MKITFRKTRKAAVAIGVAVALLLSGCAQAGEASAESEESETLVVDTAFTIQSLDPARLYEATNQLLATAMYETLLVFEDNDLTKPAPGLADYELSEDGRVVELTLREGVFLF